MGQFQFAGRLLDARPDRVDFRDRPYLPPLRPLPAEYPSRADINRFFEDYAKTYVLDQHSEGACTGFGLAALINYTYWRYMPGGESQTLPERVSPRMLYELARLYDEWDGEDYDGSSCRGAMKGWHKHGVCRETLWPYGKRFLPPVNGWAEDATERPLGAYYRVDATSLNDMQAAIHECGAVYASARIHAGWQVGRVKAIEAAVIPRRTGDFVGGHAFALVGYDRHGFVVQNSWGADWGYFGFARLSYGDWIEGGFDAWVAASGAPVAVEQATVAFSTISLQARATETVRTVAARAAARIVWDNEDCYEHAVVLGNDGLPLRRLPACQNGADNLRHVLKANVDRAYASGKKKLVLYLHGGLNSEEAGMSRVAVLGPAFERNGIHPVFIVWRTGFGETLKNIVADVFPKQRERADWTVKEFGRSALNWLDEQKDRSIELAARIGGGKAVWTEMKENAEFSAEGQGGMRLAAGILDELSVAHPDLAIHVVAHSAGAILYGHLLRRLGKSKAVRFATTTLFAPAATVDFAVGHYGPAFEAGVMPKASLLVHFLDDKLEVADTVGPYGKSLLYLVSRSFEREHKTPLLGLQLAWKNWWDKAVKEDAFNESFDPKRKTSALAKWEAIVQKHLVGNRNLTAPRVTTGPGKEIAAAHGSFDNDVDIVNATLQRILGVEPAHPVTDLTGF
jgi:hypothetical protein